MSKLTDTVDYISNPFFVGYKLSNLQYRNDVDTDNRFKTQPIYGLDIIRETSIDQIKERYWRGEINSYEYEYYMKYAIRRIRRMEK